jgi:hypothetical protein
MQFSRVLAAQEAQLGHLYPRSHAQMWEQRPIVTSAMVAERAAETRDSRSAMLKQLSSFGTSAGGSA